MRRKTIWGLLFLLILVFSCRGLDGRAQSVKSNSIFFENTGHWVTGEFLEYFIIPSDPIGIYGYPITEAFIDSETHLQVQYFQKARLFFNPDGPSSYQIMKTPLGTILRKQGNPLPHEPGLTSCRKFSQTGYEVCYAFLRFFDSYGGLPQFGYPISNLELLEGLIVQHFQFARFEWHSEKPNRSRVVVSDLGTEYFEYANEDPRLMNPTPENAIIQNIQTLYVNANVEEIVIPPNGNQTIYVLVQDHRRLPVANADVRIAIKYPDGITREYSMVSTDSKGMTNGILKVETLTRGLVLVSVTVEFDELRKQIRTSFRIW